MYTSPLHEFHVASGAKLIEFGGWNMPVFYRGINEEHLHTRTAASLFDVSHMGRLRLSGDGALPFLQKVCTRNLAETAAGQSRYSHVCNAEGGILDDVIVSRHADHWAIVCNAGNREKIIAWLRSQAPGSGLELVDETFETAMLAIQGPQALVLVEKTFGVTLSHLKRYGLLDGSFWGMRYCLYRSGYTGEDGVEAVVPTSAVKPLLPRLFGEDLKADGACKPAGLGARDTLRLEAAMPLYGHELHEQVDSLTAGQGWCVDLNKDFIGAAAMRRLRDAGLTRALVGLELEGKRIARQGYPILTGGAAVGEITSGTWSPTLQKSIALGFVSRASSAVGTSLQVDLGRKENPARVVPLPFYKRSS